MEKKKIESMLETINRTLAECSKTERSADFKVGYCTKALEILKSDLQEQLKFTKEE